MKKSRTMLLVLAFVAAFLICASKAHSQMPTVDLINVTTLQSCPSGHGFYTADPNHPTSCSTATVSCPNTAPIQITWSVTNPGGTQGTIVFFSGAGGTNGAAYPGEEQSFVPAFVSANYQTVQTAWATDWEITNNASTNYPFNIRNAACRPASFLQYVHDHIYSLGGMCAQGTSAGSAAIGYSLAWYGAASYIDKAEMLVGPTLSDVKQGCQVPNNNYTTICSGSGQLGCDGWAAQLPPGYSLKYQDHAGEVETWSGGTATTGPACGNASNTTTTWDTNWLHMSLVDLSGFSGTPSFSYPNTSMAAWLCETDVEGIPNNSGSQGELFYKQITQQSQINWPNYGVNAVTSCQGPEGVTFGTPPPDWVAKGLNTAGAAIVFDMSSNLSAARCLKRH